MRKRLGTLLNSKSPQPGPNTFRSREPLTDGIPPQRPWRKCQMGIGFWSPASSLEFMSIDLWWMVTGSRTQVPRIPAQTPLGDATQFCLLPRVVRHTGAGAAGWASDISVHPEGPKMPGQPLSIRSVLLPPWCLEILISRPVHRSSAKSQQLSSIRPSRFAAPLRESPEPLYIIKKRERGARTRPARYGSTQ